MNAQEQEIIESLNGKQIRLSVHGTRTLSDERVRILILEAIVKYKATMLVTHAEPEGVCEVARNIARDQGIPLLLHSLNFKYMRGAFARRSTAVFASSEHAILIHDGISKGTSNELQMAKKMNIPHEYHILKPTDYKKSVGFDEDWDSGIGDII